jgi:hypothetical protein
MRNTNCSPCARTGRATANHERAWLSTTRKARGFARADAPRRVGERAADMFPLPRLTISSSAASRKASRNETTAPESAATRGYAAEGPVRPHGRAGHVKTTYLERETGNLEPRARPTPAYPMQRAFRRRVIDGKPDGG